MVIQPQKLETINQEIYTYQQQLGTDHSNVKIHQRLTQLYINSGQLEAAIATIQAAVKIQPDFASIYLTAGNTFQTYQKIELAIWAYSQALAIRPDFTEAQANLGSMYYQQNRWADALTCYKTALKYQSQNAAIYWMMGNTLTQLERLDEAEFCYRRALQLQPEILEFHLRLGQTLLRRGQREAAISCYQTALNYHPENEVLNVYLKELSSDQMQVSNPATAITFISENDDHFEEQGIDLTHQIIGTSALRLDDLKAKNIIVEELEDFMLDSIQTAVDVVGSAQLNLTTDTQTYHQQANQAFQRREFESAVTLCHQILQRHPDDVMAYIILGNTLQGQKNVEAAIQTYSKALELQPQLADVQTNLGSLYMGKGQAQKAIKAYQAAIEIEPNLAIAHWNLGKVFQRLRREDEAIQCWQRALEIQPDLVESRFHFELGNALARRNKWEEAIRSYQRTLTLKPDWAEACANIGCVRSQQGRYLEAIDYFRQAITMKPDLPDLHLHLSYAFARLGNYQDAIVQYQTLVKLKPESPDVYNNLANIYCTVGQVEPAIKSFQYALKFKPDWPEVYCRLAHIQKQDKPEAAVVNLEKAIELKPDYVEAHQQLCDLLSHSTRLREARRATDRYYETCNEIAPVLSKIAYVFTYTQSGDCQSALEKLLELEKHCTEHIQTLSGIEISILYEIFLFTVPHLRENLEKNARFYQLISNTYYQRRKHQPLELIPEPSQTSTNRPLNSPLKIGFLSKHFRRHSVGWCSQALIRELAQLTPHVHLYATGRFNPDELTQNFGQMVSKFYRPKSYPNGFASVEELVTEIHADRIDVLIDLDSITVPVNIQVLHHSPAPICLTWLGFDAPYLSDQHYFLCDWHTHPAGMESFYTEKLLRLPETSVAIDGFPQRHADRNLVRQQIGIGADQVAYLCVAPGRKTNPEMVAAQVRILQQMPDAVLLRKGQGDHQIIQSMYHQACEQHGVNPKRVLFIGMTKTEEEHRSIYEVADILLDSYPYNGGTHNLEALWANLPILTRSGQQYLSRMGYSFLKATNLDVGVAWSWEEYVELGIQLGQNADLRLQIREHLIRAKQPTNLAPLWNPQKLAQRMYQTFYGLQKEQTP
ncbi:MAG: tetratricopeptide repeat protein [Microcoleaceae cyanobacterium]